jgi:DNA-binding NarL/FixJ family response regulator
MLVDDHPVVREGLRGMLEAEPDLTVVGEAGSGDEAVALDRVAEPDVVLMDLRMPGGGGVEATAALSARAPEVAVVVLTMDEDEDSVFAALRAGARGYLLKEADGDAVARALLAVARGEAVFGPRIAARVLAFFAGSRASAATPFPQLTDREREVLDLLAQGRDNASIARRLVLSEKTVRNRVSDVLGKLHARSRAEAVALARDAGLGGPAP